MTHEEFVAKLTKIFDNYAVSFEVDGRYSPKSYVQEVEELIQEFGYISPEKCCECKRRYEGGIKYMEREMADECRDLRGEVEYWKDKDYKLGTR